MSTHRRGAESAEIAQRGEIREIWVFSATLPRSLRLCGEIDPPDRKMWERKMKKLQAPPYFSLPHFSVQ
jgi:hypothetical protein